MLFFKTCVYEFCLWTAFAVRLSMSCFVELCNTVFLPSSLHKEMAYTDSSSPKGIVAPSPWEGMEQVGQDVYFLSLWNWLQLGARVLNTAYEHCNSHDGCLQTLMPHIFFTVNRLYPVEARAHTVPLNRQTPCQHWDRHLLLGSGASVPYLCTVTSAAAGARWTVLLSVHSQGRPQFSLLCPT